MIKKTIDVLCFGLMVCDLIAKPVNKSVFDVDSSRIENIKITSGGDALNTAINIARLGSSVSMAGIIGCDMMGSFLEDEVVKNGIDTSHLIKSNEYSTSTCIVLVDKNGDRHFVYYGKANDALHPEHISDDAINNARIVHLGSAMALENIEGKGLANLFSKAKIAGAITSMDVTWDSSGKWLKRIDEALYYTDLFLPSLQEAKMISGADTYEEMEMFFKKYGLSILVVKLGEKGCFVTDFHERHVIPAFYVENVVDTTGAGDAFVSGFLTGVLHGMGIYKCGVLGNAVAANCVKEIGATTSNLCLDEIMELVNNYNY